MRFVRVKISQLISAGNSRRLATPCPISDDVSKTVKILLEWGADINLNGTSCNGELKTVREHGLVHPQAEVRALFSVCRSERKPNPVYLQIGRTWMPSLLIEPRFDTSTTPRCISDLEQESLEFNDISSFPSLCANTLMSPQTTPQLPNSAWLPARVNNLVATFPTSKRRTSVVAQPEVDEFPELGYRSDIAQSNLDASSFWADCNTTGARSGLARPTVSTVSDESQTLPAKKQRGKSSKKVRWRTIEI